jgi:hypothetical protein
MEIYIRPLIALIFYSTSALLICGSAAAQTWVTTSKQAIGPHLLSATSAGNVADSTPVHVNVALQIQNKPALVEYLQQINTPGARSMVRNSSPPISWLPTRLRTRRSRR